MAYNIYKCSTCLRLLSLEKDDKRVVPDLCIITQGCKGKLIFSKISKVPVVDINTTDEIKDWVQRGSITQTQSQKVEQSYFPMFNQSTGTLCLAVAQSLLSRQIINNTTKLETLTVVFEQNTSSQLTTTIFNYNVLSATNTITGRDLTNKSLRFDTAAIQSSRVVVKKNGVVVTSGFTLTTDPNPAVVFDTTLPIGTKVSVSVYSTPLTDKYSLTFKANFSSFNNDNNSDAWSNINFMNIDGENYWVYECSELSELSKLNTKSNFKINSVLIGQQQLDLTKVVFLLSNPPFENNDRIINSVVSVSDITDMFCLKVSLENSFYKTYVDTQFIRSQRPAISMKNEVVKVYASPNIFINQYKYADSVKGLSTEVSYTLQSKKYIGPV